MFISGIKLKLKRNFNPRLFHLRLELSDIKLFFLSYNIQYTEYLSNLLYRGRKKFFLLTPFSEFYIKTNHSIQKFWF